MITKRTLLIYNFGVAGLFALVGLLSIYALSVVSPSANQAKIPPAFNVAALQAISEEKDAEKLRSQAVFYYELARDMRNARYAAAEGYLQDVRTLAFFVAVLFAVAGLLAAMPPKVNSTAPAGRL